MNMHIEKIAGFVKGIMEGNLSVEVEEVSFSFTLKGVRLNASASTNADVSTVPTTSVPSEPVPVAPATSTPASASSGLDSISNPEAEAEPEKYGYKTCSLDE